MTKRRPGDQMEMRGYGVAVRPHVPKKEESRCRRVSELHEIAGSELKDLFESLKAFLLALGDVTMKTLKYYYAFRRLTNLACIDIRPQAGTLLVYTKLDPKEVELAEGFTREMTNIGTSTLATSRLPPPRTPTSNEPSHYCSRARRPASMIVSADITPDFQWATLVPSSLPDYQARNPWLAQHGGKIANL